MSTVNTTYFVDVFQDIIDHVILKYDPIVVGPPQTGGEKPYGMYGHIKEVLQTLSEKDNHKTYKFKKYPLIVLVQDFEETADENTSYQYTVSPRFLFLDQTLKTYKSSDRYTNVYKPVLYKLYKLFLEELADNPLIWQSNFEEFKNKKIDRVNWGTQTPEGFNDALDGIDVTFPGLRIFRHMESVIENLDDEQVIYAHG